MILRVLRDGAEREVDLYATTSTKSYDPTGKLSTRHVALVVAQPSNRFVFVWGPAGIGWLPVDDLHLLARRESAM